MSTLLQQVLIERPKVNPSNWNATSLGGLQDINGNQVFYTLINSQSNQLWSIEQKIDVYGSMEKAFNGDPRFIIDDEVEQGGYQIKPVQELLIIYRQGRTKTDLDNLKIDHPNISPSVYKSKKSQIVEGIVYNGSQIASGPGFAPYVNDFKIHPTQQQREQIGFLEKMAADNGIEIRHWGTRRFYSPTQDVVVLPTRDHFASPEGYMRALAHEMVHATMHKDKNNPLAPTEPSRIAGLPSHARPGDRIYAAEEWRADAGSLRILEAIGVNVSQTEVRNSAAYLNDWARYSESDPLHPGQSITGRLTPSERQQAVNRSLDAANYLLRSIGKSIEQTPQQTQELHRISQVRLEPATDRANPTHHAAASMDAAVMAQATPTASSQAALAVFEQYPALQDLSQRVAQALPQLSDAHNARLTAGLALQVTKMGIDVTRTGEVQLAEYNDKQMVRIDDPSGSNPFTNFAVVDSARVLQQPAQQRLEQMQQLQLAQTQQHSQHTAVGMSF